MESDEFYTLLHVIAEELDGENIKMVRYLCKDCMPHNKKFGNAFELLQYMEISVWITHSDMEFLAEILYWINRRDLLKRLPGVKSRRDYEVNYLLKDRYFSTFRITCFLVTQELLAEDFQFLKNFCRIKLSTRNYQRSEDIYELLSCLEEEDVFSEGDLGFMLTCFRRLDNQKPYKLFENLSLGDYSLVYPSKELQQTVASGYPRHTFSLPNLADRSMPAVYHVAYSSYPGVPHDTYGHCSTEDQRWSLGESDDTDPHKTDNITTDGCAAVQPRIDAPNFPDFESKFFTEGDHHPSKRNSSQKLKRRSKEVVSNAEESTPRSATCPSFQTMSSDSTLTKGLVAPSNHYSSSERTFSEIQPSEDQCLPSYLDGSWQPGSPLHSIPEDFYTPSVRAAESVPSVEVTDGPSVDLSAPTKENKGRVEHYEMNSSPAGMCVIINNMNFEEHVNVLEATRRLKLEGHDYPVPNVGLKNRVGSAQDIQKVSDLFKSFGFVVEEREDLDSRAMHNYLVNISRKDHSAYDCFVLIIMSHGALGSIYGVDGMPVRCAEIKSIFKPASCPTLLNKPKVFFFQACQGEQTMEGHSTAPVADIDDIEADGHAVLAPPNSNTPSEADFLICYSTVPGYISYRSRTNGSFFINFVVDNLKNLHPTEDVLSIMTHVNLQLANHSLNQTAMPVSTLRKKVFFRQLNQ